MNSLKEQSTSAQMFKIIKTDNINRFIDDDGKTVPKYDSSKNLTFVFKKDDDTEVRIDSKNIKYNFGESMSFDLDDYKYIIDDGYRDILIKCGYIILNNYDTIHVDDFDEGVTIRNNLIQRVHEVISNGSKSCSSICAFEVDNNYINMIFESADYCFNIVFNTITGIVSKNEKRIENKVSIYPFEKKMDKFGTLYLSIFAQKKEGADDASGKKKFIIADEFIHELISNMNSSTEDKYRFKHLPIKRRVYNWEGI